LRFPVHSNRNGVHELPPVPTRQIYVPYRRKAIRLSGASRRSSRFGRI
jgi:hypothetical protein